MSNLVPFTFEGEAVRVVEIDGEPWFVGKDVAERLGYADPTNAMKQHCRGVVKHHPIVDALGRKQKVRILSEPDVLRLIIGSKLPAAERFEEWVVAEVLPSICKTGRYDTGEARKEASVGFQMMCEALQSSRLVKSDLDLLIRLEHENEFLLRQVKPYAERKAFLVDYANTYRQRVALKAARKPAIEMRPA